MLCRVLDAVAAKAAFRLPGLVEPLAATVGLDRTMASYVSADAKRLG